MSDGRPSVGSPAADGKIRLITCVKMAAPRQRQLAMGATGPRKRRISPLLIIGGAVSLALALCIFSAHHVSTNTQTNINAAGSLRPALRPASNKDVPTIKRSLSLDIKCQMEHERVHRHRTKGLSEESIARSRAWVGNRQRLDHLAGRLASPSADGIAVITFGGSITLGHGVASNATPGYESGPYGFQLRRWLNDMYGGNGRKHTVHNLAAHGADMCALEKRITGILSDLDRKSIRPDLFLLEFAVNDYQGQDHIKQVDSKTDIFFDGFQSIALCCEVVIHKLLHSFPHAAIAFLEFRTAITNRKTGQLLHLGVAQHYEVPVISYAEAMFPEYFRLISMLNATDRYTVPKGETLMPFPYGCHPCYPPGIETKFNHFRPPDKHCRTVCDLVDYSGDKCDQFQSPPAGRDYCYPPIFAVDAVHPSTVGHRIAKDLITHMISNAVKDRCLRKPFAPHALPTTGWLGAPTSLSARSNFIDVRDTDCFLPFCKKLQPVDKTAGFTYYSDVKSANFEKFGWISTNKAGNESITFAIDVPKRSCYAVYVAILRSYDGMGQLIVEVENTDNGRKSSKELDGLWNPRISVWSDNQIINDDDAGACTGKCKVTIRTKPQIVGRSGNKVKILTLSARECSTIVGK